MRTDTGGLIRALVLAAWAGFLVWLLATGEVDRYIGPRTYWVVVFGAIASGAVALVQLATLRPGSTARRSSGELLGSAVMLLPLLAVVVIPAPSLGSLAASRKLSGAPVTFGAFQPRALGPGEEVSFPEIEYASESEKYAASLGITDGFPVTLVGFVSETPESSAEDFPLTRFAIYCCAADVVPHTVEVDPADDGRAYKEDQWVRVRGALQNREGAFVLVADRIDLIAEPSNPYLR